jgi:hypothetical protein
MKRIFSGQNYTTMGNSHSTKALSVPNWENRTPSPKKIRKRYSGKGYAHSTPQHVDISDSENSENSSGSDSETQESLESLVVLESAESAEDTESTESARRYIKTINDRFADYLKETIDHLMENDGIDIYAYHCFRRTVKKSNKEPDNPDMYQYEKENRKCTEKFNHAYHSMGDFINVWLTTIVVIGIQVGIPIMLLISQIAEGPFYPSNDNAFFRIAGFLLLFYSTLDLRKQIINQITWAMISNNRLWKKLNINKDKQPRIKMMYLGLYINMLMSVIVTLNTYLLYCQTETLIDMLLNTVALNFLLAVDNEAMGMLTDANDVAEMIEEKAQYQIRKIRHGATRKGILLPNLIRPHAESALFMLIYIYTTVIPCVFMLHNVSNLTFEPPEAFGEQNMTTTNVDSA